MSDPHSHRSLLTITSSLPECGTCPTLIHPNEWEFKPSHLCDAVSKLEPSTPRTASEHHNHSPAELRGLFYISFLILIF